LGKENLGAYERISAALRKNNGGKAGEKRMHRIVPVGIWGKKWKSGIFRGGDQSFLNQP